MCIKKSFKHFFGILSLLLFTSVICMASLAVIKSEGSNKNAVDSIIIQSKDKNGKDQMPGVMFLHDLHTQSLKGKDCSTCHLKNDKVQYKFKFMRTDNFDYDVNMTVYHENCIGCHNRMKDEGKQAGPNTGNCRACHNVDNDIISSWKELAFDKSLHYRHVSSESIKPQLKEQKDNCSACHHEYNKKERKTVYIQGKEGSCNYCHLKTDTTEARSSQAAVHESCLNCHLKMKAKKTNNSGPTDCEGCHSEKLQKKIKVLESVPRIKRNQPDSVLLATGINKDISAKKSPQLTIYPVAFDHKIHEGSLKKCQDCHHKSLDKCSTCHTSSGDKKGDFISLDTAMHNIKESQSCVGCHEKAQYKKECAGCHTLITNSQMKQNGCQSCHSSIITDIKQFPVKVETQANMAQSAINKRKMSSIGYEKEDVPEKVTIEVMKKEYEAVSFPHRKIVDALLKGLNKDSMGKYFHKDKNLMCQGCHHNSKLSVKPPKCVTCHTITKQMTGDGRPALKGAYHGQCIGCHNQMDIKKPAATACIECHKKKS